MKKKEHERREGGREGTGRNPCTSQLPETEERERDRALQQRLLLEWISLLHTDTHPPAHPPKLAHVCTHICLEIYLSSLPSSEPPPLTYACTYW